MMKTSKNKQLSGVGALVVMAAFNAAVFLLPFKHHGGFWVGFTFINLALAVTACVGFYSLRREGLKSKFYGASLVYVAWDYLAIQFVVGIIEMIIGDRLWKYALVLNIIILAAALIGLIQAELAKSEVEKIDQKIGEKVFFIKSLQGDFENLTALAQEAALKKSLAELAETVRFSDPISSPQLAAVENKIETAAAQLAGTVNTDDHAAQSLVNQLNQLFAERNRECKLLKNQ